MSVLDSPNMRCLEMTSESVREPWLGGSVGCSKKLGGLIPSEDTCLNGQFGPQPRCVQEATNQCFSLTSMFLSLPSSLSKTKEKMSLGED